MEVICRFTVFYLSAKARECMNEMGIMSFRGSTSTIFEVIQGTKQYEDVLCLLEKEKNDPARSKGYYYFTMYTSHYTTQEFQAAKYMTVRSTYDCLDPVNTEEVIKRRCFLGTKKWSEMTGGGNSEKLIRIYQHYEFEGPVIVNRKATWKKHRWFCTTYVSPNVLFCNNAAKKLIEETGLRGASFYPVLKRSTMTPVEDIWQLIPKECDGFLTAGKNERVLHCSVCGSKLFERVSGISTVGIDESKLPGDLDFLKSPPVLLSATNKGESRIFISQKAWKTLTEASCTQALVFEPVKTKAREAELLP